MKTINKAAKEFAESEIMETYDSLIEELKRISFIYGAKFAQEWISMKELDHVREPILIKDDEGNIGLGLSYLDVDGIYINILYMINPKNPCDTIDKDLCTIIGWRPIERK